jgi:iron complex outermembrane recepter protein
MYRLTPRSPIAAAIGLLLGTTAVSQSAFAQAPAPQKQDRIEVTGSNIKRTDLEGPLPIDVITRQDIERKGVTSTNELIRSLPYMSSYNDELFSNSPSATGSATVGFRGLDGNQTVVLLNGRRLANYGFDGAFVSLSTIPLGAIERVEVLKDGAAAIYGADAIGGIVNFITRKDYRGVELSASYGVSGRGDSDETSVTATAGFGNYAKDGFNVLANFSYFKREPLMNLQRERTRTADYRRFGGSNQLSTFAPSGNFLNPTTNLQRPFGACDPALVLAPSLLSPGVAGSASCMFDFAPYRTTLFPTDRTGGVLNGRLKLGADMNAFAEVMWAKSSSFASAAPTPGNFTLNAAHPANTFGVPITVRGRPLQAGPRTTDNDNTATRIVAGIEGAIAGYDFNVAVGQAKNKAVNNDGGYFLLDRMNAAIANGTFNPFSLTNPQSVLDSIKSTDVRTGETKYTFVDGKISGELMQLGGGALAGAVGFVSATEEIADIPGPQQRTGNVFGSIQQSQVRGDRKLTAIYAELGAPITKQLEMQFAVRSDKYDTANSTTPKLALRYQPMPELLVRTSVSQGFKMPSLRDLFGGLNQSADSVQDFVGCRARNVSDANCPRLQYDRFSGGNAQLQPEKAKTFNLGLVFEPSRNVSMGVDWFSINKTDEIGLVLAQFVIDNVAYRPGATATLNGNPAYAVTRNAAGTITSINTANGNLGERKIRGFDLTANFKMPIAGGRLSVNPNVTYYTKYDYADLPGTPLYARAGLLNLPQWKSTFNFNYNRTNWDALLTHTNLARMYDKVQSTAATPVTAATAIIGNFETWDLTVAYSGIKNLRLSMAVKNLMDAEPGFSNNDPRTLGFAQVHDIRGRYFQLGASYKF